MSGTQSLQRRLAQVALKGNCFAFNGDYLHAVACYSHSIDACPQEYSFFVNRALCYIKMDFFYLALYDINKAVELEQSNSKCYFIRSKILKKLNEYELAESDLIAAAHLDPNSDEIGEEIARFKESSKEKHLFKNKLSGYDLNDKTYYKIKVNFHLVQAQDLPTNLWSYHGVRVENIRAQLPIDMLRSHFSLFGDIKDVKQVHSKVNNILLFYDNPVTPMFTIAYFQNRIDEELCAKERGLFKPLKLYFAPTDSQNELKFSRPKHPLLSSKECYYWRTTSCNLNSRCPKLHLASNKNIDTQIWMKEKSLN